MGATNDSRATEPSTDPFHRDASKKKEVGDALRRLLDSIDVAAEDIDAMITYAQYTLLDASDAALALGEHGRADQFRRTANVVRSLGNTIERALARDSENAAVLEELEELADPHDTTCLATRDSDVPF